MADQVEEILDVPREFFKDGVQFINRCQKRTRCFPPSYVFPWDVFILTRLVFFLLADQKEFLKLCQAVGIGFGVMGAVGFVVKLSAFLFPPLSIHSLFKKANLSILQYTFLSTASSSAQHKEMSTPYRRRF